jgi:hypothetical protein
MTDSDHMSLEDADNLLGEARYRLRAKDDRDHALATANRVYDMVDHIDGSDVELADLYERLYVLLQDLGNDERCEQLVQKTLALEATLDPPRPVVLGTRQLFYAMFLHRLHRYGEAGRFATDGLASYALGVPTGDRELGYLRSLMEPIQRDAREHPAS